MEKKIVGDLKVKNIYLRFFDVKWDSIKHEAIPVQEINFTSDLDSTLTCIPVVYITNEAMLKNSYSPGLLAKRIVHQVKVIAQKNNLKFREVQVDCDWSDASRINYFDLLQNIKDILLKEKIYLSATIRLHQIKYYQKTGVPPVEKGMLMYYNMGKIDANASQNSIYNFDDASKYVDYVSAYPLPLDVAVPIFSWAIHSRNGEILNLMNDVDASSIMQNNNLKKNGADFVVQKNHYFHSKYLKKNDVLKLEEITPIQLQQLTEKLSEKMENKPARVVIYDLDSMNVKRFSNEDFEKVFNSFN